MHFKILFLSLGLFLCALAHEDDTANRRASLYDTVDMLLNHAKYDIQDTRIAVLLNELKDARSTENGMMSKSNDIASTYTRWGRRTCSNDSVLVYEGFAAGGEYMESGAPANYICLPKNPDWDDKSKNPQSVGLIYGSEYQVHGGVFNDLHDHDVPCAVCRVPRSNILMVPGKNTCFENYVKEYHGYLMAGHPTHKAASEYVCVDTEAEKASMSLAHNHNGMLFYFVRAKCGSLKCPPYKENDDLTCVVCSYSPKQ